MSTSGAGVEAGAQAARSRALAVLRIRSRALAVALVPAAGAVVLLAGGSTGRLAGTGWDVARWILTPLAVLVLLAAAGIALVIARARPAMSPTVAIAEEAAPDLYRMVRDLADRLDVPAPSAIALTPDCDSWLEDRTHPAHGPPAEDEHDDIAGAADPDHRSAATPVLVIGSPFLWWMRVGELRAVLAPVVAGTGPSAHPDIAAARRFVRGLDAAVAVASEPGRGPVFGTVLSGVGSVARLLLRGCRVHAAEMERGVAAAAAERAQAVDYGLRIVAQEQVGLAYAGWDRLLTRVALPAWRMGRWPAQLNAGVVAALTELSRRDRLAEGFASRLGERPACDLLEEPGAVDEAASLLAARLFHGGPAPSGRDWAPVHWGDYPEEVVDRKWRTDAARLHRALDALGVRPPGGGETPAPDAAPTLSRVLDHLTSPHPSGPGSQGPAEADPHRGTDAVAPADAAARAHAADADGAGSDPGAAGAGAVAGPGDAAASGSAASAADTSRRRDAVGRAEAEESAQAAATDGAAGTAPGATGAVAEGPARTATTDGAVPAPDTGRADAAERTDTSGSADDSTRSGATERADTSGSAGDATRAEASGRADESRSADGPHRADAAAHPDRPRSAGVPAPAPERLPAHDSTRANAPAHADQPRPADAPAPAADPPPADVTARTRTDRTVVATPPDLDPQQPPEDDGVGGDDEDDLAGTTARSAALAARLSAEVAREEAGTVVRGGPVPAGAPAEPGPLWDDRALPLFPLQPPRSARELLADHITAMICCAAMDTAGAVPGLDWLDGPVLLVSGERASDLSPQVLSLIEDGDPTALRLWLTRQGIRPEKPVRLV